MPINFIYPINKGLYSKVEHEYPTVISTTEYSCGGTTLTHLRLGANRGVRLNSLLSRQFNENIALEQFFLKKVRKLKSIPRSAFEKKLKALDARKTSVKHEVVKEYSYTNRMGKADRVQVVITATGESAYAMVDFPDADAFENFVCPAWLEHSDSMAPASNTAALP